MGASTSKDTSLEHKVTTLENQLSECENEKNTILHTNFKSLSAAINSGLHSDVQKKSDQAPSENNLAHTQPNISQSSSENMHIHKPIPEYIQHSNTKPNKKNIVDHNQVFTTSNKQKNTNDVYDIFTSLTDEAVSSMHTAKLGPVNSYNTNPSRKIQLNIPDRNTIPNNDTSAYVKSKQIEPNAEATCNLKCRADPNCELFVHNKKTNFCWYKYKK